ncbi:MAG TPA: hypothetical protein VGE52_12220, partial [Pirellulales bacterium]
MAWSKRIPFQVSIAGVIELMGTSLYSRVDTPLRELVQNAHDAIQRRRQKDLGYSGKIRVVQDPANNLLHFHDDGIGLSAEDAEKYLGVLGIGVTGLLRGRGQPAGANPQGGDQLIGMFGIGLFSSFMLADKIVVESRRIDVEEGVRWEAGPTTEIEMSSLERDEVGSTITLHLKPEHSAFSQKPEIVEQALKQYADFLGAPIFLNDSPVRVNVIHTAWFDATPSADEVESALEAYFDETPLDVIPLRTEQPVSVAGSLYVTPQRTPGFSGEPTVAVTVRRMVISRSLQGLLPPWAMFLRGVLELNDCSPTTSREDLVRDRAFLLVQGFIEDSLHEHFEDLARRDRARFQAVVNWHRYSFCGAALTEQRLRNLLRSTYSFPTSHGPLTFEEVLGKSEADPLVEMEAQRVVWYNADRRQERWANQLFAPRDVPCVHTLRSFEESLLAAMVEDAARDRKERIDLRAASPRAEGFAAGILGVEDMEDAPPEWQEFLHSTGAKIYTASFTETQPVMAFLNERHELMKNIEELRKQGTIPAGFQRIINRHFEREPAVQNEVLLNRRHRLVQRALSRKTSAPLACVLRLLVQNALASAGAVLTPELHREQTDDL